MTKRMTLAIMATSLIVMCATAQVSRAADIARDQVKRVADSAIKPLLEKDHIPGMSIGIIDGGKSYVFNYGVASIQTRQAVTNRTLFEMGSISKTFTATLASWAQAQKHLSLSDPTDKYLSGLENRPFGRVTLLELGTHTPGGVPLQVPEGIHGDDQLLQYLEAWKPRCAPGMCRTYSNVSVGVLGLVVAKSLGRDFVSLMEKQLFPALGMRNSYIQVPEAREDDYAQGYTKDGKPTRMTHGVLSAEAYGIKSTTTDMLRFIDANVGHMKAHTLLQEAITKTHTAYFKAGSLTQDLIWEQYAYPVTLQTLLKGNSAGMTFDAIPTSRIMPPQKPKADVWINKTGSTNGFAAYVAFIPSKQLGIVILANKNYPTSDRVTAAYQILSSLARRNP